MKIDPPSAPKKKWGFLHFLIIVSLVYLGWLLFFANANPHPLVFEEGSGVKYYSKKSKNWTSPSKKTAIVFGERIKVLPGGYATFSIGSGVVRVFENSEIELRTGPFYNPGKDRISLENGSVFVSSENEKVILTASRAAKWGFLKNVFYDLLLAMTLEVKQGVVLAGYTPDTGKAWAKVLEGSAEARAVFPWKTAEIQKFQKVDSLKNIFVFSPEALQVTEKLQIETLFKKVSAAPIKIVNQGKKASTLAPETLPSKGKAEVKPADSRPVVPSGAAPDIAAQGLLKGAKPFSTKSSRSEISVKKDGDEEFIEMKYDVSAPGSLAGINFPVAGLDFMGLKSFEVEVRAGSLGGPSQFRIEFKAGDQVLRVFDGKLKTQGAWEPLKFAFKFTTPAEITDISFMLTNTKAGANKTGSLEIKNLKLS